MKRKEKPSGQAPEIRRFQKKIIAVLAAAFFLVAAAAAAVVFVSYRSGRRNEITRYLESAIQGAGAAKSGIPAEGDSEAPEKSAQRAPMSGILLLEEIESTDSFTVLQSDGLELTDEEAVLLGETIYSKKKTSGREGNWYYLFDVRDGVLCLAVTDAGEELAEERRYLFGELLVLAALIPAILLFAHFLSKWLVKPLKEAREKQTNFILAAGHELKTPLAVMRTSFDMMEQDGVSGKYFRYARSENEKMTALVTELLDLSRLDAEREPKKERFDLSSCIEGAVLPFEASAYEKGAVLKTSIQPAIWMRGDEKEIGSMAGILTDNAVHHAKAMAGEEMAKIEVRLSREGRHALLAVSNEGDPIPEEEREKIFERFYRVDKARNRSEGRFGLGLSIARSVVLRHGGKITVSCEGGVTTFLVTLPCEP